jgi:hypothetical protein
MLEVGWLYYVLVVPASVPGKARPLEREKQTLFQRRNFNKIGREES